LLRPTPGGESTTWGWIVDKPVYALDWLLAILIWSLIIGVAIAACVFAGAVLVAIAEGTYERWRLRKIARATKATSPKRNSPKFGFRKTNIRGQTYSDHGQNPEDHGIDER